MLIIRSQRVQEVTTFMMHSWRRVHFMRRIQVHIYKLGSNIDIWLSLHSLFLSVFDAAQHSDVTIHSADARRTNSSCAAHESNSWFNVQFDWLKSAVCNCAVDPHKDLTSTTHLIKESFNERIKKRHSYIQSISQEKVTQTIPRPWIWTDQRREP